MSRNLTPTLLLDIRLWNFNARLFLNAPRPWALKLQLVLFYTKLFLWAMQIILWQLCCVCFHTYWYLLVLKVDQSWAAFSCQRVRLSNFNFDTCAMALFQLLLSWESFLTSFCVSFDRIIEHRITYHSYCVRENNFVGWNIAIFDFQVAPNTQMLVVVYLSLHHSRHFNFIVSPQAGYCRERLNISINLYTDLVMLNAWSVDK